MDAVEIVGREPELEALRAVVAAGQKGPSIVSLEGEAGVGKTTLWLAATVEAEGRHMRVLRSRPAATEATMSFAGLADLLDGVIDDTLDELPAPQARALSSALQLEDGNAPSTSLAVGAAFLGVLGVLTRDGPVAVAVDDIQWLDPASATILAYAVRRLRTEPIAVLLAHRSGVSSRLADELSRSISSERLRRIPVASLGMDDLGRVITQHLGTFLSRPLLTRIGETSGGNPFYALELARALQRGETLADPGRPLRVPATLRDAVEGRLTALPAESRLAVLATAALAQPTLHLVTEAVGEASAAGIAPALTAKVLELDGDRLRFAHPLLAAAAYEMADPARRASLHSRLAELVDDPEEHARHLAAAADRPDERVAAALEEGARAAQRRGALEVAAQLLEQAHALTPPHATSDRIRRVVDGAYCSFEAGDSRRARTTLEEVIGGLPPGNERAHALLRLARVRSYDDQRAGAALFGQAIDEAQGDRVVLATAHEGRSACLFRLRERLAEAVEDAALAAEVAEDLGDGALLAEALGSLLAAEAALGRESARATVERALGLQEISADHRVLGQPLVMAAVYWWWTDDLLRARDAFTHLLERTRTLGDESSRAYILVLLGLVQCSLGDLDAALASAEEGREVAEQSGQATLLAYNLALAALAEAKRGQADDARALAHRALELVPTTGGRPAEMVARTALGQLELALGRPDEAATVLGPIVAHARAEHLDEPGAVPFVVDYVEALIELGRYDECTDMLDWFEANADRLQRRSALGGAARCRGLLSAAAQEDERACAAFEDSLARYEEIPFPLDRGRSLLAMGAAHRRRKRKAAARKTLGAAVTLFDSTGAAAWRERARAELARISGRAPTLGALTPTEERVAALVAEGKTNREVAAALFLSDRTVEGHLTHVYAKLDVRSRTELTRLLAATSATPDNA